MKGDTIFVRNLALRAITGLDAWKRPQVQNLFCSLQINAGQTIKKLGLSDDLQQSLNYDAISQSLRTYIEKTPYESTQDLAIAAAKHIKAQCWPEHTVELKIRQPKAFLRSEGLEITVKDTTITNRINGLKTHTIIGINPLERVHKQEVIVDIELSDSESLDLALVVDNVASYIDGTDWLTIESFTNAVAQFTLERFDVPRVGVSARKPSALNLADAAGITVTRTRAEHNSACETPSGSKVDSEAPNIPIQSGVVVYLAFGTNMGDRVTNIRRSIGELARYGVSVESTSQIYESEPAFFTDQARFLNGVFKCRTDLSPQDLLKAIKEIEYGSFSRVKLQENGPRSLDLDILFYDSLVFETPELSIPHSGLRDRAFVLVPLADVCDQHPVTTEPIQTLIDRLDTSARSEVVPVIPLPTLEGGILRRDRSAMMAILNATPDSFSDGGKLNIANVETIAKRHIAAGATILDIGGLSTRPGSEPCTADEEIERVVPVIERLKLLNVPLSIDTFRSSVASAAVSAGAEIINDVFAGQLDENIWRVARDTNATFIASHARGNQKTMVDLAHYNDVVEEVAAELSERVTRATEIERLPSWQLVLDPGLGFAKAAHHDLELVREFKSLRDKSCLRGFPWLVGPSRKRFVGKFGGVSTPTQRDPGTAAVLTALVAQKCDIIRVHNTAVNGQALSMANALYRE